MVHGKVFFWPSVIKGGHLHMYHHAVTLSIQPDLFEEA